MCSIPGLPTPGSEVTVNIKRVNLNPKCDFLELWVNIDITRNHAYEQMKEQIQCPKRKFFGPEAKPGDLCLVCVEDKWHRARVKSVQSDTYEVFLIDQGQPNISCWDALAWGHSENFFLPPELESCILANVLPLKENWPKEATKFLESLPGKTLNGVVQHVLMPDRTILLDIPFVSQKMYTLGAMRKLQVDEFKEVVIECLTLPKENGPVAICNMTPNQSMNVNFDNHYFYPELLCGIYETVHVTEVKDPHNIFCNLQIFSKSLKTQSEVIQHYYKEFSDTRGERPQTCGEPCAAKGNNGKWYRSLLKQNIDMDDEHVEVVHVDVGKTELVPVGCIRYIEREFLKMPVVTYCFSLHGVDNDGTGWTASQNEYLKSLLLNKTFVAKIEKHFQETYTVTLYAWNAECMNNCFIEKSKTVPSAQSEGQQPDVQIEPSLEEQYVHVQKLVNLYVKNLQEERLSSTEDGQDVNGDSVVSVGPGDVTTREDQHLSQNLHDEQVFSVGSTVDVRVSYVEGPQKFWCQRRKNGEGLQQLMGDLQKHYASVHPLPIDRSLCVACNPDDGIWYRSRIVPCHRSVEVDVQFLDFGGIRRVPLGNICPIDQAFLHLEAQAFQCCLVNPKANSWNDSATAEFQMFLAAGDSQHTGFKCTVKDRTFDNEGQPVNVVDLETPSQSACSLLSLVPTDTYDYSTYDIEVGTKENAWITSSETVHHFFCQLNRNCHLFDKMQADVQQLVGMSECSGDLVRLNTLCLVRYADNKWYRGKVVQTSPELKVHFVDYGDTLTVNLSNIQPLPVGASMAKSVPVLAIPLGLFGVPSDVPREVNQWFSNNATGTTVTISVVAKGDGGKLMVELFEGLLNVNVVVREKVANAKKAKNSKDIQSNLEDGSKTATAPDDGFLRGGIAFTLKNQNGNGTCGLDEQELDKPQDTNLAPLTVCEHEKTINRESTKHLIVSLEDLAETPKGIHPEIAEMSPHEKSFVYHTPSISHHKLEEMYASCIVGPSYFWCQFAQTENLNTVCRLTQSVGEEKRDTEVPKTLNPGSPCLALFPNDSQWYRAQVLRRNENTVCILFVDYGNESEVDIKDLRYLSKSLIEHAPQAFLCSLDGFNESQGSWDDQVYEDFYNLLVDKPLMVTVLSAEQHSEILVQEHSVNIQCAETDVNQAMQKYWKPNYSQLETENIQKTSSPQYSYQRTEPNMLHFEIHANKLLYKSPNIPLNKTEVVYASCIVEPHFFWCQFANTEDLNRVVELAQEVGRAEPDPRFSDMFGPGCPCIALFTTDNQWYRALVTSREQDKVHVVFIDYGNESDVDVKNVRPLSGTLQEYTPQAFLCSLNGFDQSEGSWDDDVYDNFYNLLMDKPISVMVSHTGDHPDITLPQHMVEIDCEGVSVNTAMQKYWTPTT
ncbi:tudor domain-containing 6 [Corythoichthys intestinalis]|uniref:tudor domain-containing 6 n=1 Tax=Corythoichthys intestinalis TaxID=161448 RepID=UPI0025A5D530|nr:tudor domain-containing 6 [Corythoichthys intestinalis]XP_061798999.1 tudor domain-containing 6-like [Nerophis lumbriciformis]